MRVAGSHGAPRRLSERGIYSASAPGGLKSALRSGFGVAVPRAPCPIGELAFRNQLLTPISGVTARLLSALLLSLAVLNLGCISTERTVYREEDRVKVQFENDSAGRLFYEALSKLQSRRGRSESKTEVSIPVVFNHKRRVVEGESIAFNQAVRRCDTNGDGRITELEARIFAEQADQKP